jgi:hypothetical protein
MSWLADLLFDLGRKAAAFSRKRPPDVPVMGLGRNHILDADNERCVYCDAPYPSEREPCPGPK